jgi:hypothetical protein
MSDLTLICGLPEVKSAVLGDLSGAFLDEVEEPDGEGVAAVMGFFASLVGQAGSELGLGALERVSLAGATDAHAVLLRGAHVIAARLARPAALAAIEKAWDDALQGRR